MNNVHDYSELRKQIKAEIDEAVFQSAKEGIASGLTKAVENQFRIEAGEVEIDAGEIAKKVTSSIQKAIKREMKKEKVQGIDVTEIISLNSKNVLNEIKQMYDDEVNLTAKGAKKMLAAMSLAKNQGIGEDQIREKLQFTVKDFNKFAEDLQQTTGMSQKAIDEFGQNVIAVLSDVNSHIDKIIEDSISDFNKVNSALNKNIKAEINAFNEAIKGLDDVEFDRAFADPKKYQEMEDRVKQGLVSAQRAISILLKQGDAMPALNQLFQSVVDNFVTSGGKKSQMLDFWNGVAEQVREGDSALKDLIRDLGLLKSDGSTLTISTGANNLGGLIGAENIVKARKIIEGISGDDVNYTSLKRLQELLTDAANAGANVSRILDIVNDSTHGIIMTLEEALPGKDVENLIDGVDFNPQFLQASDKAIQKLIDDLRILYDLKAGLDVQSGNIKYDELTDQFYLFDIDTKSIHKNFEEVMDDLKTFFGWQEDELRDMGDTVNAELVNKFTSRISEVYDASRQLVNSAAKGIQETQDSHSDAKLTKPLGEDFAGGYAAGIEQGKERVSEAAEGLVEAATESTKRAIKKAAQEADNIEVGFVDMNQEDFSQAWKELTSVNEVSDNVAESLTDTLKEEFSNAVDLVEEAKELKEEIKEVLDDDDIFVTASGPLPWDDDYEDAIAPVKAVEKVTEEIVDNVKEASEEVKETVKTVKEMSRGEFMKFSAPSQQALKIADKIAQGRSDQTKEEIAEEIRKIIVDKDKNSYRKIAQKLASQADKELIKSQEHVAVKDYISKSGPVYLNEQVAGDLGDNLKRLRQVMGFDKVTTRDSTKTGYDVYLKGLNEATGQAFSSITELLEFLNAKKEEEEANFKQMYEAGGFEDLTESIRIEVEKYLNNYSRLNAEQRATIDKREQNILKKKEPQKPVALTEVAQQAAEEIIEKKQEETQIDKEEEKILDKRAQDEARINAIYEERIGLKKESIKAQEEYNRLNEQAEEMQKKQSFYEDLLGKTLTEEQRTSAIEKYNDVLEEARQKYQTIEQITERIAKQNEKEFPKGLEDQIRKSASMMALYERYRELSGANFDVNEVGGQQTFDFYSGYYGMTQNKSADIAGQLSEVNQELYNINQQKNKIVDARPLFVIEQEIVKIIEKAKEAGKLSSYQKKKLTGAVGDYEAKGGNPFVSQALADKTLLSADLSELFGRDYGAQDIADALARAADEAERAKRKMSSKEVIEALKKQKQEQENVTAEIKATKDESEKTNEVRQEEIKNGKAAVESLEEQQQAQQNINALVKDTSSQKESLDVIEEKSKAFEEERQIVNSSIDGEIGKLHELADAVKGVTKAVREKTKAFENENATVSEVMNSEISNVGALSTSVKMPAVSKVVPYRARKTTDDEYTRWWIRELDKRDKTDEQAKKQANDKRMEQIGRMSKELTTLLADDDLFGESRVSAEKFLDNLKEIKNQGSISAQQFEDVDTQFVQINAQAKEMIKSQRTMNNLEEQLSQIQSATVKDRQKYMPEYLEQVAKASELIQERRNSGGSLTGEEISGITRTVNASKKSNWSILTGDKAVLQRNIAKAESLLSNNYVPARFKDDLQEVVNEMRALESQTYASKEAIDKSTDSFRRINMEINKAGKSFVGQIGQRLTDMNAKFIAQYFSLMDIIRYLRTMYTEITNIDSALIELKKVTDGLTMERLQVSLEHSFDTARRLGSEVTEVINTTADWARLGYGIADAEKLAEVTTLFKNVGDNMTTDSASEYLISTLKGFEMAPEEALSIVDRFNEVANNFAIDTAGIGEALERSSASFNAANTNLSESIALVTTANAVVQNPESVGTTFKTLSARIRGAKTELEELGEEEDDFTKSTSKLRDMVKGMTGFDIMEDEDTFKSIYEILLGIGKEWDNLTDVERASLGEALAGKRNSNVLFAIMNNIEDLEKVYATAENAAGSATKEQENYQKSIQYSVDVLKAEMSELYTKILNSEDVKKFVDLLAQALSYIVKIADKIPTIALVGGMFGTSALLSDSRKMGNVIKFFKDIVGATTTLKQEGAAVTWKNLTGAIIDIQKVGLKEGETTPVKELAESLHDMELPDNYQQTLLSLGKTVGLIAAITIAAYGLSKAIDAAVDSVAEIEKRMEDASEKIKDYDSKLSELNSRLDEISNLDMSQYSETQQKNLQNEAEYVSKLIEQYKGLKVAYEESYAKDREKLWWGDQKYNPFSTSVEQMVSGDIGGSFETYYSSGLYKGDNKLLKFLINGVLGTSAVGQFINQEEDNKSEALDNAIAQYEELGEKIDKAREKRVEYLEKANTEENTEWDNKHDAYYSQQRADAFREKADKEESKLIELNKERSDIISDVLEKQTELMEMREQLNNKSPELFTEEDALTLDKIDEELEKIQHFLDDNSNPTAVRAAEQLEDKLKETKNVYENIGALLSQDTLVEDEVFDQRYDALQREYDRELELAKKAGAELNRTVYGNIDLDDRGVLEWNEENLEKYKDAVESWGGAIEDYANSISTVDAMSEEFDGVEIAFTPMLQTPNGPEYLDSQTVHDYLNSLIKQMPEGWTNEDLLKLDAKGIEVDGKKIKGLIAEIGDEAIRVGETMHYLGEDGSLNTLRKQMEEVQNSAIRWSDIRDELVGMAQAGQLDENTLQDYKYFDLILKEMGIDAKNAENYLTDMVNLINEMAIDNAVDDLSNYRTQMNKLEDAYSKFKNEEFIDANTLSALQDAFGNLDSYQEFEKAVMEGETDLQQYFDNIATEYAKEKVVLANLNEENKEAVKQNLILAGITEESADASVEAALKKKKSIENEIRAEIELMNTEVVLNKGRKDLAVSTENLDKLTAEEIVLLMNEANASGEAAQQVALFMLKKELASGKDLRNPDDLDYLTELIIKCGVAADEIDRLKRLGEMSGTIEDAQAALDAFDARYSKSDLNKNSNLQSERQKLVNKVDLANKAYDDYNAGVGSLEERLKGEMEKVDYTVDLNFDYSGAVDSAEKAGSEAAEDFKNILDKILAMYDAELDAGVVSFQTYVDKSRAIIQQYYNDGKIKASEYYDYLANLYEKQVSEYDKVISAVQRKLKEQTDELEKQKEAIEESYNKQIEEIQAKIDALQDENDEIEKNIALQKAQYELARARNQRTKLMYSESRGFYYEADLKGIQDAQENVRKAQLDKTVSDLQKKITTLQDAMKKETDVIDAQIKKLNEYAEQWGEVSSKLQNAIEDQRAAEILGSDWEKQILDMRIDTLQDFTDQYIALQKAQKDAYLEARRAELNEVEPATGSGTQKTSVTPTIPTDDPPKGKSGGEYSNKTADKAVVGKGYKYNGKTYATVTEAQAQKQADVKDAGAKAYSQKMQELQKTQRGMPSSVMQAQAEEARKKAEANANKKNITALFSGTESAKAGNALVGELGSEIVLDKNSGTASIVEEPTIMKMKGGEKVFNAEETEKILKSKYVPLKQFNPKKFAMLHAFANGTSSPMQSMIAAQAVGIANGINNGWIPATATGGTTVNQTFNVSLPNITDASKANDLFKEFEQLQRKATQFFNK